MIYKLQLHKKLIAKSDQLKSVSGFTLIELIVVIAIIGILTAAMTVSFSGIRGRNRDAQRKTHLKEIQVALELYRTDAGSYPTVLSGCGGPLIGGPASTVYLKKIPCDPLSNDSYDYNASDLFNYTLTACLENKRDKDATTVECVIGGDEGAIYEVTNP